jgi:hypothetical protein
MAEHETRQTGEDATDPENWSVVAPAKPPKNAKK